MTSRRVPPRIAVLGAGLQGACLALELAARGARVDLHERNDRCVAEASAHNEGKTVARPTSTIRRAGCIADPPSAYTGADVISPSTPAS